MRTTTPMTIGGLGAAVLGLLYANYAFGPTEAEVATWGRAALIGGVGLVLGAIVVKHTRSAPVRLVLGLASAAMALFNVIPAIFWAMFHGRGISDGSPPTSFVADWALGLPHLAVAAVCLFAAYGITGRDAELPADIPPGDTL